ncbi:MAG: 50S ribosomal protein L6 [Candidatus Omnitrophica bacterium]|nr:50S ribosomal protein L6 [Candidatus Omnitrophota bacterium]
MSRTGKNPIDVPKTVKVNVQTGNVSIEGSKGKLDLLIPYGINVEFKDDKLTVIRVSDSKQNRSNHGTIRSRLANMVVGVTSGHKKDLEIQGIGFRANLQGKKIAFSLGFSHPVEFDVPDCVTATVPTQTSITIEGPDNVMVGQIAAKIRDLKPVEPYKGKGIRYVGEFVRRKQGKSATK